MRKLSPPLYFAYPTAMALRYNQPTDALALSVAAALSYRSEDDSQSMQIANVIATDGLSATVRQLTGIEDEAFVEKVGDFYNKIITFAG